MSDLQQELEHLALADQHLAAGERRIDDLIIRIKEMTARGEDTTQADQTLRLFEDTLVLWQGHWQMILDAITRHAVP
jgi:hypothetical protein